MCGFVRVSIFSVGISAIKSDNKKFLFFPAIFLFLLGLLSHLLFFSIEKEICVTGFCSGALPLWKLFEITGHNARRIDGKKWLKVIKYRYNFKCFWLRNSFGAVRVGAGAGGWVTGTEHKMGNRFRFRREHRKTFNCHKNTSLHIHSLSLTPSTRCVQPLCHPPAPGNILMPPHLWLPVFTFTQNNAKLASGCECFCSLYFFSASSTELKRKR